nr:kisspeptin1 [Cynoglossus semilaevis]
MLRLVALMMATLSTVIYNSSCLTSTHYDRDQVLLRALRDFRSTSLQQTIQHSGVNSPAEEFQRKARKVPGTQWWRSRFPLTPQAMKRHQDIFSYNLNSFGLRYGK